LIAGCDFIIIIIIIIIIAGSGACPTAAAAVRGAEQNTRAGCSLYGCDQDSA